jgi:sec-independent protein translocase protein TatA
VANVGPLELGVVLIIALVIFGPKRLPDLGRSMGQGMREFKKSLSAAPDEEQPIETHRPPETKQGGLR